jgi:LmbE family N-acetylglucosaminyl deacetylase
MSFAAHPLNVLVVAAHPDDAEIGMGGTIARLADQGHRVLICDLTDGSPTPRGDRASRLVEAAAAMDALQPAASGGGARDRCCWPGPAHCARDAGHAQSDADAFDRGAARVGGGDSGASGEGGLCAPLGGRAPGSHRGDADR